MVARTYSVDQDTREFNIEGTSDGLKMHAPDLLSIKLLEIHHDDFDGLSADGQSECSGEGAGTRGSWLIG